MAMMSGSSIVPSTCEWLDRICSIRVEPARGRPTMKIGSAPARRSLRARRRTPRVNSALAAPARGRSSPPGRSRSAARAQPVARGVVLERLGVVAGVLQRLAQREVEVQAVLVGEVGARELRAHRARRPRSKRKVFRFARLQYASPSLGAERDAPAIGVDASSRCGPRSSAHARSSSRSAPGPGYSASTSRVDLERFLVVRRCSPGPRRADCGSRIARARSPAACRSGAMLPRACSGGAGPWRSCGARR